jgi:hypothetical protein
VPPALQISGVSAATAIGLAEYTSSVWRCLLAGAVTSSGGRAQRATPEPYTSESARGAATEDGKGTVSVMGSPEWCVVSATLYVDRDVTRRGAVRSR